MAHTGILISSQKIEELSHRLEKLREEASSGDWRQLPMFRVSTVSPIKKALETKGEAAYGRRRKDGVTKITVEFENGDKIQGECEHVTWKRIVDEGVTIAGRKVENVALEAVFRTVDFSKVAGLTKKMEEAPSKRCQWCGTLNYDSDSYCGQYVLDGCGTSLE